MAVGVRAGAVAAVLVALSCGQRAQTGGSPRASSPANAGEATEDEVTPEQPASEAEDLELARAIDRKICRKHGCCVSGIEEAGTDRKGRSLVVATIDAGDRGVASCLVPHPAEPEPFGSGALDKEKSPLEARAPAAEEPETKDDDAGDDEGSSGGEDEGDGATPDDCHPYEYHLVVHSKGKIRARQFLADTCNNGYGFAGVGEDDISVDAATKTFTRRQSGGSNWRWDETTTLGLDPFRLVSHGRGSFWTMDEGATQKDWDLNYDTLQGTESWSFADCEARRKQAEAAKQRDGSSDADEYDGSKTASAIIIPRVQLPAGFVDGGWRTIGLGNCGALVDGDENGFAVYGGKGKAGDASMRVVVSKDGVLFVEVADDRWTRAGKSWVKEDHIELWLAPPGISPSEGMCDGTPTPDSSRQWGIRISDGQVFPGFGSPEPLPGVEVVRNGATARAKIPIAEWVKQDDDSNSITVVYSDSDDGLRQKRLIATSAIERGQELTLGHVRQIEEDEATCVLKGKALRIDRTPHKRAEAAKQ